MADLSVKQTRQRMCAKEYLATHEPPAATMLVGRTFGTWAFGPSYSRSVEALGAAVEDIHQSTYYPHASEVRHSAVGATDRSLFQAIKSLPPARGASVPRATSPNKSPSRPLTAEHAYPTRPQPRPSPSKADAAISRMLAQRSSP